ncbi:MAG: hypothetical protein R2761_31495 [Acidimicrobiales bacterium]
MAAAPYTPAGPGVPGGPMAPGAGGGSEPPPIRPGGGTNPLVPHLIWEAVLAVGLLAVLATAAATDGRLIERAMLPQAGVIALAGAAMALSVWSGAPNLAIGSIAVFTAQVGAWLVDGQGWPLWPAMAAAVVLALPIGLVMGLLAGPIGLPGWAVTLASAMGIEAVTFAVADSSAVPLRFQSDLTYVWLALGLAAAIATAGLTWAPGVRALAPGWARAGLLSPPPPVDDRPTAPAPAGPLPGTGPLVALLLSSVLAAVAGVAQANRVQAAFPQSGFGLTTTSLAVALLGGASAFGGRLGLVGTALASLILSGVGAVLAFRNVEAWSQSLTLAAAAFVGLIVGAVLGRVTRN